MADETLMINLNNLPSLPNSGQLIAPQQVSSLEVRSRDHCSGFRSLRHLVHGLVVTEQKAVNLPE